MFREAQPKDYQTIADFSNINRLRETPIWCRTSEWTYDRVEGFFNIFESKGGVVSLAYEEDGELVSLFAGWRWKNNFMYELGVIDPRLPNYMDLWKEHTAKLFKNALDDGAETIRIRLTDDKVEIVEWMEKDLNMIRHHSQMVWKAFRNDIQKYVNIYGL